jgi:Flp pilus assembly protein TadG
MPPPVFRRDRRSSVALLFAIMAIPVVGIVGLAIDYAFWNQTYASMSLAANGAALNAVKTTSTATLANDPQAVAEGVTAGKQWFIAQLGTATNAYHENVVTPSVVISTGATTTATVTYNGYVPSIFGNIFNVFQYPINLQAQAEVVTSPYLNVEILLDNSPSMEIGATAGDIAAMMYLTPCSVPGAIYNLALSYNNSNPGSAGPGPESSPANQPFSAYSCNDVNTYDGQNYGEEGCPITGGIANMSGSSTIYPDGTSGGPKANALGGQICDGLTQQKTGVAQGQKPLAGAPCAFACHFDTTDALGPKADYYGLARNTVGVGLPYCYAQGAPTSACQITLRFDLVKQAVNQVINTMETDNIGAINNLNVGVFTFDQNVEQVYPIPSNCGVQGSLACQAGNQWATALTAVGLPPTEQNTPDTGILPYNNSANSSGDTNLPNVLTTFANYVSPAGNGSLPTSPLKVLFLVTDGMADYTPTGGIRQNVAIDPSQCDTYKDMGFTVYVLYTPYYPLMNGFYLSTNYSIAEGTGAGSLIYNLQQCASDPVNDFIEANPNDAGSIAADLKTFLKRALTSPARFTQ